MQYVTFGNDGQLWSFWLYFMLILFKSRGYGSQLASKTASEASAFCKLQKIIFGRKWHFWYLKVGFCFESLYKLHSAQRRWAEHTDFLLHVDFRTHKIPVELSFQAIGDQEYPSVNAATTPASPRTPASPKTPSPTSRSDTLEFIYQRRTLTEWKWLWSFLVCSNWVLFSINLIYVLHFCKIHWIVEK